MAFESNEAETLKNELFHRDLLNDLVFTEENRLSLQA